MLQFEKEAICTIIVVHKVDGMRNENGGNCVDEL